MSIFRSIFLCVAVLCLLTNVETNSWRNVGVSAGNEIEEVESDSPTAAGGELEVPTENESRDEQKKNRNLVKSAYHKARGGNQGKINRLLREIQKLSTRIEKDMIEKAKLEAKLEALRNAQEAKPSKEKKKRSLGIKSLFGKKSKTSKDADNKVVEEESQQNQENAALP